MRRTVVEREVAVEQAHEGSDGRRRIVVLGLGEQQRGAAFDIAQVDVVAERGADDRALRRSPPARPRAPGCSRSRSGCSPASMPCRPPPCGCALVKISASGPMPTSRYCDQAPCSISTRLSSAACATAGHELADVADRGWSMLVADRVRPFPGRRAPAPRSRAPAWTAGR